MDISELTGREGIRDLVARYNSYGDRGRSAEVAALFTPDGTLELRDGESRRIGEGSLGIESLLETIKNEWADASGGGPAKVFHTVGTHVIDMTGPDSARGHAYVTLIRAGGLGEWGRYVDEYALVRARWRFRSRLAVREEVVR